MTSDPSRSLGKMTVGDIPRMAAACHGDREALLCAGTGRRASFRQIDTRSNQLAHALLELGLKPGAVVAFICSNRLEIIEIYFALAKAGLVGLPLNYRLAPAEVLTLTDSMNAVMLICEGRFDAVAEVIGTQPTGLQHYVCIGPAVRRGWQEYEQFLSGGETKAPHVDVRETDPYYFNLTSGTTGLPKAYVVSHYSACEMLTSILSTGQRFDEVCLTVFPVYGRVGFSSVLTTLMMGARTVLANFNAEETLALIEEENATFMWLVPTMAAMMLEAQERGSRRLSSLRAIAFVGAMLPGSIRDQTRSRLCPHLYEGYGLQECGMLTISTPEDRKLKPDSVGKAVLFAEVSVVDEAGEPLPAGTTGQIVGRSPNCITGYHQSPDRNLEAFRNGWFHTGDIGHLDDDGYLFISGRVKDMIISGGQNIHSAEVEAALLRCPGVGDCAVLGLPHDVWGEVLTAIIVPSAAASSSADEVREFCRQSLAGFKVPRLIAFQHEPLPRTPTGKVQKFLLAESYRQLAIREK